MWGGTVLIHVLPNVVNRITPDNAKSSPLPDPHESGERGLDSLGERVNAQSSPLPDPHRSGERGLASLGERVKIDRSDHELGKISLSWASNYALRH
jgi:hypothetical protein